MIGNIMDQPQPQEFLTRHVIQGEYRISRDPREVMTTILGSCVSTCLYDSTSGIGGMNHFLLSDSPSGSHEDLKYGLHAMELLINELLKNGADMHNLNAKLFGGANLLSGRFDIGQRNYEFAEKFLEKEGIPVTGKSIGGKSARRIRFWPTIGASKQLMAKDCDNIFNKETSTQGFRSITDSGSVEVF